MLAMALAMAAAGVASPACGSAQCRAGLSAPDVFTLAERYAATRRFGDAETLLKGLTRDNDPDYRAEARFRLSILREAQGDRNGAIEWLKALLDEKPDAGRPRLELARLLAVEGDEAGARRELRKAGAAGLPEDVARVVDRFALALRSARPIGGAFEVALAPDSNLNRSTARERVDTVIAPLTLSKDARAQSGVGVSLSAQGFARTELGDGVDLLSRVSARADLFGKSRFNDVVLSLASGPEFRVSGARLRPAAIAQRRWFGGEVYADSYGGSLNLLKPLGRTSQIEVEATMLRSNYRIAPVQDGLLTDVSIAFDHALSPRFSTRIAVRGTRQDARAEYLATRSAGVDLLASRSFGKQLAFVQLGLSALRADDRDPLFGRVRDDRRYELTGGLILRRFAYKGLSPLVRIIRTKADSTIPIYEFKRTRFEFALSRAF